MRELFGRTVDGDQRMLEPSAFFLLRRAIRLRHPEGRDELSACANARKTFRWAPGAVVFGFANLAGAAEPPSFPSGNSDVQETEVQSKSATLEQLVVTANRRPEKAQALPIMVESISSDNATAFGITDMQSLANAVPGLRVDRSVATALPFIRGIGSSVGQVGAESSVAVYVDDVYTPAAGAAMANFDSISSIEVDKGPQGTVFGRNATGGVIQVFTRNPTPTPSLDFNLGYANYDTQSGSMYASAAVLDDLNGNLSLYGSDQHNGWGRNLTTGAPAFNDSRFYGGRVKFLWTPTGQTTALLALDHDDTRSSEGYYRPAYGTVGAGFYPAPAGYYDLVDHTNPYFDVKQGGASLKVTQDTDWARVVSISAWRSTAQEQHFDQAAGPTSIVTADIVGPDRTITQELQVLSREKARLSWIGGLFFMRDSAGYDPLHLSGLAVAPLPFAESFSKQITRSYAAFADMTWEFARNTRLTAGVRYTTDRRSISASANLGNLATGPASNSPQSGTASRPSGRLSLDRDLTSNFTAYVAFNRGFKSGGFNTVVTPGAPIGSAVQPETLDDYSVGEKAELLDHRLRLNSEAFWYAYKNIQVTRIVTGGTALSNAAKATIKGLDLDATWLVANRLTLTAGLELLDGHYDNYPNGVYWKYLPNPTSGISNVNPPIAPNLAGNRTIYTPPFSSSLRGDYVYPTTTGRYDFAVAYNHGGGYYFDPDNGKGQLSPSLDRQPILNLVDLSLDWLSSSGRYEVRAWGKNVTGQKYISFGFEEALLTQFSPAPPATFGITFGLHVR